MKKLTNYLPTTMGDSNSGSRLLESKLGVKVDLGATRTVVGFVRNANVTSEKSSAIGKRKDVELLKLFSIQWRLKSETGFLFCIAIIALLCSHMSLYLQIRSLDGRNRQLEEKLEKLTGRLDDCLFITDDDDDGIEKDGIAVTESADDDDMVGDGDENAGVRQRRDVVMEAGMRNGTNASKSNRFGFSRGMTGGKMKRGSRGKVMKIGKRFKAFKRRLLKLNSRLIKRLMKEAEPRAVYLLPAAELITVRKKDQVIGPWLFMDNGTSLGFTEQNMWYKNIELGDSSNSVVFQESGLFLISAQLYFYRDKASTVARLMGFRIYLRKSPKMWPNLQRSIALAECIPAQPVVEFQTCFTQVTWFLEEGDEIYLSNYMDGLPQIQNDAQGQTFLGIVKL